MSNRVVIELLLTNIATNSDQGWEWMRAMHEAGYQLQMGQFLPFFCNVQQTEFIQPELSQGTVVWIAGLANRAGVPKFPDPVAAMVWWTMEKSNRQAENDSWDDGLPKAPLPAQMIQPPSQPWVPLAPIGIQSPPAPPQQPTKPARGQPKYPDPFP